MEEWFDVVDKNDQIVGRRRRTEVHQLQLFHRAAHILVFNRAGQLFLQKRSETKDDSPGLWDSSAAGHLVAGEDYLQAARRELAEELGVTQELRLTPLWKIDASAASEYEFAQVFRCEAEGPFDLDAEEIDDGRWLSVRQINTWVATHPEQLAPTFRQIWCRLIEEGRV